MLQIRLQSWPFALSTAQIGSIFLISGVTYMTFSVPLGWVVDRSGSLSQMRMMMALGLGLISVSFMLMGPIRIGLSSASVVELDIFNNLPCFIVGNVVWGFGQCFALIPTLPEMLQALPTPKTASGAVDTDRAEALRTTVTGLWMSVYAAGCVLGPIAGTTLMSQLTTPILCRSTDFAAGTMGTGDHANRTAAAMEGGGGGVGDGGGEGRSVPHNCFDGFCTTFAIVYLVAAACTFLRGLKRGDSSEGNQPSPHVPLGRSVHAPRVVVGRFRAPRGNNLMTKSYRKRVMNVEKGKQRQQV
jgi:hypothetical protein